MFIASYSNPYSNITLRSCGRTLALPLTITLSSVRGIDASLAYICESIYRNVVNISMNIRILIMCTSPVDHIIILSTCNDKILQCGVDV